MHAVYAQTQHVPGLFMLLMYRHNTVCLNIVTNTMYLNFIPFCSQLSFIQHSLMNPDVFCFADYPCHTVAIDILKAPPEDDNREIATW